MDLDDIMIMIGVSHPCTSSGHHSHNKDAMITIGKILSLKASPVTIVTKVHSHD